MVIDRIRKVESEQVPDQAEAVPDGAVLATQDVVGFYVQHDIVLAMFGFAPKAAYIVLGMFVETGERIWSAVRDEARSKPSNCSAHVA